MTREFRLMLAEQGAAEPELAGRDVHRGADPRDAEIERLRTALRDLARQKLFLEMDANEQCGGDFYYAYDEMIRAARAALEAKS